MTAIELTAAERAKFITGFDAASAARRLKESRARMAAAAKTTAEPKASIVIDARPAPQPAPQPQPVPVPLSRPDGLESFATAHARIALAAVQRHGLRTALLKAPHADLRVADARAEIIWRLMRETPCNWPQIVAALGGRGRGAAVLAEREFRFAMQCCWRWAMDAWQESDDVRDQIARTGPASLAGWLDATKGLEPPLHHPALARAIVALRPLVAAACARWNVTELQLRRDRTEDAQLARGEVLWRLRRENPDLPFWVCGRPFGLAALGARVVIGGFAQRLRRRTLGAWAAVADSDAVLAARGQAGQP